MDRQTRTARGMGISLPQAMNITSARQRLTVCRNTYFVPMQAALKEGVRGSNFYDFLPARTAGVLGVECIVTLYMRDCAMMTDVPLELPARN